MKVLAVLHYQRSAMVEVPDPKEDEELVEGVGSRRPNWKVREGAIKLAEEAVKGQEFEWLYSDYFKEAEPGDEHTIDQDGTKFECEEWFDV